MNDEQIIEARRAAPFYCPGCGSALGYPGQCVGSAEAPHPAIQVVDTAELDRDPDQHTAAPDTGI